MADVQFFGQQKWPLQPQLNYFVARFIANL